MGKQICLARSFVKSNHFFSDVIMGKPFYPVAYPFLPGKKQCSCIYGYIHGSLTRTRTRKRCILRSLIFGAGTVTKIAEQQHILDSTNLTTTAVQTPYRTKLSNLLKKL